MKNPFETIRTFRASPTGRLFDDIFRRHRVSLISIFVVANLAALCMTMVFPLVSVFVRALTTEGPLDEGLKMAADIGAWVPFLSDLPDRLRAILALLVGFSIMTALSSWLTLMHARMSSLVNTGIGQELLSEATRRLMTLPMSYFDQANTAETRARFTEPPVNTVPFWIFQIQHLLSSAVMLLFILVSLFWISPVATLMMTPLGIVIGFLIKRSHERVYALVTELRTLELAYAGGSQEIIEGMRIVKQTGQKARFRDDYVAMGRKLANQRIKVTLTQVSQDFILQVSGQILIACAFAGLVLYNLSGFGGYLGVGAGFLLALMRAFTVTKTAVTEINTLLPTWPQLEQFAEFMAMPETPDQIGLKPDARPERFDAEGIWFSYGERGWVLQNVDVKLRRGQTTAILGLSGSGKSTLLEVLARLRYPQQGTVSFDGLNLDEVDDGWQRSHVGYVNQDPFIFNTSLRENLVIATPEATPEKIEEMIQASELTDVIAAVGGIDAPVGDRGRMLSGGQRQRLALARVFLQEPTFLIMDEATSALDIRTERRIFDYLQRTKASRGLVVATHRLVATTNFDSIVLIHDGRIMEAGTHSELMRRGGMYADLYRFQTEGVALTAAE